MSGHRVVLAFVRLALACSVAFLTPWQGVQASSFSCSTDPCNYPGDPVCWSSAPFTACGYSDDEWRCCGCHMGEFQCPMGYDCDGNDCVEVMSVQPS